MCCILSIVFRTTFVTACQRWSKKISPNFLRCSDPSIGGSIINIPFLRIETRRIYSATICLEMDILQRTPNIACRRRLIRLESNTLNMRAKTRNHMIEEGKRCLGVKTLSMVCLLVPLHYEKGTNRSFEMETCVPSKLQGGKVTVSCLEALH